MPLSSSEQSELAGLVARYGMPETPAAPQPSLWGRAGQQAANLPSNIGQGLAGSATGLLNLLGGDNEIKPWQIPKPYDIAAPTTFGEKAVDFGANLASNVGQFLVPGGAVSKLGRLAGMGAAGAAIAGDVAAGAFSGLQNSPQDAALGAGEFGALGAARFLPWYARLGVNAAVPVAGQLARGIDPTSGQALAGTGAQMIFGQLGRRARWNEPVPAAAPPVEAPPGFTMREGTPPQWTGNTVGNEIVPYEGGITPVGPGHDFTFSESPQPQEVVGRRLLRRAELPFYEGQDIQGEFRPVPGERPQLPAPRSIINPVEFSPDRRFLTPGLETRDVAALDPSAPEALPDPRFVKPLGLPFNPARAAAEEHGVIYQGTTDTGHGFIDPENNGNLTVPLDVPPEDISSVVQQKRDALRASKPRQMGDYSEADIDAAIAQVQASRRGMTPGSGESGSILNQALIHAGGGAAGGLIGYTQGDTPEERAKNALIGVAIGAGAPWLLRKGIQAGKALDRAQGFGASAEDAAVGGRSMLRKETAPAIIEAYDSLTQKTGFPAVSIGHLAAESGLPLEAVKAHVLDAWKQGKAVLSQGDFSLSDEATKAGAVDVNGDRMLQVRMLPKEGAKMSSTPEQEASMRSFWIDRSGNIKSSIHDEGHADIGYGVLGEDLRRPETVYEDMQNKGYTRGTADKFNITVEARELTQAQRKKLIQVAEDRGVPLSLDNGRGFITRTLFTPGGMTSRGAQSGAIPFGLFSKTSLDEAAMRNERGSKSMLDRAARQSEVYLGRNLTNEVRLAVEKGKGFANVQAGKALAGATLLTKATPAEMTAARAYWESPRAATDKTILRTTVSPDVAKAVEKIEGSKAEIQQANFEANAGSTAKQEVFKDTPLNPQGNWQGRFYQAFVNPKKWDTNVGPKRDALITELAQDPDWAGYDHQQISAALDEYGASIRNGESVPQGASGATHKLDRRLTIHRKDLTDAQWKFLDTLRADPKLTPDEKMGLNDIYDAERFNDGDQAFLRNLAADTKRFSEPDRLILSDIASEKVLSKATREYLGEITDPLHREILSAQKLINGAASAKIISHLRDSEVDGRKLIYTTEEHTAAKQKAEATGNAELDQKLRDYVRAPDRPGLGSIAGQWVDRQVLDALNAQQRVTSPWMGNLSALNRQMKDVMTAWNPGTHSRNIMQIPLQAIIARVAPWELGAGIRAMKDPAMADELATQGIRGANYAKQELDSGAKDLQELFNPSKTAASLPGRVWYKIKSAVHDFYGLPDDIVRTAAYVKRKKIELAKGLSEQEARDAATTFVNRYTMNFGAVAPAVKALRNIPFVSPFISYNAEMLRILKNLGEDAISGTGEDRAWAVAGMAQLLAVPLLVAKMGEASLKGKDRDDWEKLKALEPTFLKHMLKVPLGREKDGSFRYFSFGPIAPAGDFAAMMRDAARGDFKTLLWENPFAGLDKTPAINQIVAQVSGEDPVTHAPVKTFGQRATRLLQSVTPALTPGIGNEWQRDVRAFTPNDQGGRGLLDPKSGRRDTPADAVRGLLGLRTSSENPSSLLNSQRGAMNDELSQASQDARRLLRSNAAPVIKAAAQKKLLERQADIRAKYAPLLKSP